MRQKSSRGEEKYDTVALRTSVSRQKRSVEMTNMDGQGKPPSFRIFTCGTFLIQRWDGAAYQSVRVDEWGGSQDPRRLLKKLACRPGRRARRGAILESLWPDID